MPDPTSRRSLLRAGAGVATGLAGASAGCLEILPPLGREIRLSEAVTPPDRGPPQYREWTPAPDPDVVSPYPGIVSMPNLEVEARTGIPWTPGRAFLAGRTDYFGVGFGNYSLAMGFGGLDDVVVLEGPVDRGEVAATLDGTGYESDPSADGLDRFVREDVPRTVEVTEGRIVFGTGPQRDDAIQSVRAARRGDRPRRSSTAYDRVTDEAGTAAFLMQGRNFSGFLEDLELEWFTATMDVDDESGYVSHYHSFRDATPSRERVTSAVEDLSAGRSAEAVEVRTDGRFVAVETRHPLDEFRQTFDSGSSTVPHSTWGVDRAGDPVVLRHEAGEPVAAEDLTVATDWEDGPVETDVQFADEYETVGPGSTLALPREAVAGEELTVWYLGGGGRDVLIRSRP